MFIALLLDGNPSRTVQDNSVAMVDRRLFIKDCVSYDIVEGWNRNAMVTNLSKRPDAKF